MTYLYGLLDGENAPDTADLDGVTGTVGATRLARGWLIHGPGAETEILPRRRHLLAHARVQERLMEQGTLLPMRFGMVVPDLTAVMALIAHRHEEIGGHFDRLAGKVEIGLRVAFPREAALEATLHADAALLQEHNRLTRQQKPPHFAVAEFGRRLAEALDRNRGAAQRRLIAALRDGWDAYVLKTPDSDVEVLAVECLIPVAAVDAAAARAQEEARALASFAGEAEPLVRIVGPLPAFHFVTLSLAAAEPAEA